MSALPPLHIVTDDDVLRSPDFLARAAELLDVVGPRGALHIRGHKTAARALYDFAIALAPRASRSGAWLVINDRLDIALAAGMMAVQVGARSFRVEDVRRVAPGMRVGESVHAVMPTPSVADWVMAGHVFDTPSHADETPRGLEFVRAVVEKARVPVIAIGGVKVSDVEALQRAGAYGLAIIRGVWHAADSARAVREYLYFVS